MFMTNVMNCCVYSYLIDWLVGKLISKNTLDNRFNESMGELFPIIVIFLTYSTLTCKKVFSSCFPRLLQIEFIIRILYLIKTSDKFVCIKYEG